jgi:hypothetical protein
VSVHDHKHDTKRTPESKLLGEGHPGDPGLLGHGQPTMFATSVPEYSETGVFYEKEDASARAVIKVGMVLGAATIFAAVFTLGVFKLLAFREDKAQAATPDSPVWVRSSQPPEPRLQATIKEQNGVLTSPQVDLATLRREERALLGSYGWVDKQAGTVRIPIDDAMRLYAERGAQAEAQAPAAATPAPSAEPPLAPASEPTPAPVAPAEHR